MNISYDYYRVFYYVAKYKSFTGAAHALLNNQPNVTRIMKKLEEELGCTLFVRQRHGVALTPEGEKLYAHISIAFEHILSGEKEIARDRSLQSGIVTIAASEIALHCVLLPILKSFRKTYPGIRVRISSYTTPQAIDVLKKGLADLAIVTEPFELSAGLVGEQVKRIREVPVCSTAFSIPPGPISAKSLFQRYPLISLGEQTGSFSFYSEFFRSIGLSFAPDVEAATADQILPMVKSDLGIGFVPEDFIRKGSMENLMLPDMNPSLPARNICILKRKDASLSIAAAELEQLIKK